MTDDTTTTRGGAMRLPRTRGAVSGVVLVLLGAWGALAPFVGPYFSFSYTPDSTWVWTAGRGWFEVLPGGVVALGGLLLLFSANRVVTSFGGWLAIAAGAWFVVTPQLSGLLTLGSVGHPAASFYRTQQLETLAFFTGLGAAIIFFAAIAVGRLSVRSVRDVQSAQRRDDDAVDDSVHAEPDSQLEPVATTEHPDAAYAPGGAVPAAEQPPADAHPVCGGPAYATPQRYVPAAGEDTVMTAHGHEDHLSNGDGDGEA